MDPLEACGEIPIKQIPSSHYGRDLFSKLQDLKQGNKPAVVVEYMEEVFLVQARCNWTNKMLQPAGIIMVLDWTYDISSLYKTLRSN